MDGVLDSFETAFYQRETLPLEQDIAGPAIILQKDTTTVVPPGATARADTGGNLFIRLGGTP